MEMTRIQLTETAQRTAARLGGQWRVEPWHKSWPVTAVVLTAPAAARHGDEAPAPLTPDPYRILVFCDRHRIRLWSLAHESVEPRFADQLMRPRTSVSASLVDTLGNVHLARGMNRILQLMETDRARLAQLRAEHDEKQAARQRVADLLREAAPGSKPSAYSPLSGRDRAPCSSVRYSPEHGAIRADGLEVEADLTHWREPDQVTIHLEVRNLTPQRAAAVFRALAEPLD